MPNPPVEPPPIAELTPLQIGHVSGGLRALEFGEALAAFVMSQLRQ